MQKQSPLLRIWGWGKDEHGRIIGAAASALIAVVLGMLPYFSAAQIIVKMLSGERNVSAYLPWLGLGLAGYAARTFLYNMALSISHKATFPMYGVGPIYGGVIIAVTAAAVIAGNCDFLESGIISAIKIPSLIIGILLIVSGLYMWINALLYSKIDDHITNNKLATGGVYSWVRNPIYSAFMFFARERFLFRAMYISIRCSFSIGFL